jgi:hypothetical protein
MGSFSRITLVAALGAAAAVGAGCSADVTGLRVRFDHTDGDVHQYVVRVTDASGALIHECIAPGSPSAEAFLPGETWTVLFDDERAGSVTIEVLAVGADGQRTMRGTVDYFMSSGEVARPTVILTANLGALVPPVACVAAPRDSLPSHTPRGSVVTVDERGTFAGSTDSGI